MRRIYQIAGTLLVEGLFWLIDKRWGDAMFEWLKLRFPNEEKWLLPALEYLWDYGVPLAILGLAVWFFWQGKKPPKPKEELPATPAPVASYTPLALRNLRDMPNEELRREVGNHAHNMRAYEAFSKAEDPLTRPRARTGSESREEWDAARVGHRARVDLHFKTRLLPIAQALHQELLDRLGIRDSIVSREDRYGSDTIENGMLAGPSPMTAAAGYLEMLARKLP